MHKGLLFCLLLPFVLSTSSYSIGYDCQLCPSNITCSTCIHATGGPFGNWSNYTCANNCRHQDDYTISYDMCKTDDSQQPCSYCCSRIQYFNGTVKPRKCASYTQAQYCAYLSPDGPDNGLIIGLVVSLFVMLAITLGILVCYMNQCLCFKREHTDYIKEPNVE